MATLNNNQFSKFFYAVFYSYMMLKNAEEVPGLIS